MAFKPLIIGTLSQLAALYEQSTSSLVPASAVGKLEAAIKVRLPVEEASGGACGNWWGTLEQRVERIPELVVFELLRAQDDESLQAWRSLAIDALRERVGARVMEVIELFDEGTGRWQLTRGNAIGLIREFSSVKGNKAMQPLWLTDRIVEKFLSEAAGEDAAGQETKEEDRQENNAEKSARNRREKHNNNAWPQAVEEDGLRFWWFVDQAVIGFCDSALDGSGRPVQKLTARIQAFTGGMAWALMKEELEIIRTIKIEFPTACRMCAQEPKVHCERWKRGCPHRDELSVVPRSLGLVEGGEVLAVREKPWEPTIDGPYRMVLVWVCRTCTQRHRVFTEEHLGSADKFCGELLNTSNRAAQFVLSRMDSTTKQELEKWSAAQNANGKAVKVAKELLLLVLRDLNTIANGPLVWTGRVTDYPSAKEPQKFDRRMKSLAEQGDQLGEADCKEANIDLLTAAFPGKLLGEPPTINRYLQAVDSLGDQEFGDGDVCGVCETRPAGKGARVVLRFMINPGFYDSPPPEALNNFGLRSGPRVVLEDFQEERVNLMESKRKDWIGGIAEVSPEFQPRQIEDVSGSDGRPVVTPGTIAIANLCLLLGINKPMKSDWEPSQMIEYAKARSVDQLASLVEGRAWLESILRCIVGQDDRAGFDMLASLVLPFLDKTTPVRSIDYLTPRVVRDLGKLFFHSDAATNRSLIEELDVKTQEQFLAAWLSEGGPTLAALISEGALLPPVVKKVCRLTSSCFSDWRGPLAEELVNRPLQRVRLFRWHPHSLDRVTLAESRSVWGTDFKQLHTALKRRADVMGLPKTVKAFQAAWLGKEGAEFVWAYRLAGRVGIVRHALKNLAGTSTLLGWHTRLCQLAEGDQQLALHFALHVKAVTQIPVPGCKLTDRELEFLHAALIRPELPGTPSTSQALRDALDGAAGQTIAQALGRNLDLRPLFKGRK